MARPPKLSPPVVVQPGPLSQIAQTQDAANDPDTVAAHVTGAFDQLRTALGQTVPAHVNSARASAGRYMKAVS